ncbi:MAG: asparagine synthetase B family protein [Acidimicrobiales bacterium]
MCGIALVIGARPDGDVFASMLDALEPRGDVTETLEDPRALLGTRRLRIVDRERAIQPWVSTDGRWACCYNGEVFNFLELRDELQGLGRTFRTVSDTEVVLEAFLQWGESAVARLRGEFAFAIVDRHEQSAFVARDPVGVKPLFWSIRGSLLHVASEVKALVGVGAAIHEVPPGHHGWSIGCTPPELVPYVDLLHLGDDLPQIIDEHEAAREVRSALEDSIRVRVATDLPVGVILSGGLDSTLVMLQVREMHPDCVAFTIGTPESEDLEYARRVARDLKVSHEVLELRPRDIRFEDIREAVRTGELTEYGDVINAVVSNRIFGLIQRCGVRVVLSGDGSDELFGGYDMYRSMGERWGQQLFQHNLRNLSRTELQRVDRTSMAHSVECRVPFLDLSVAELAMRIPTALKVRDGQEKWILRHAFSDVLPGYVRERRKNPLSHSTGLHERIRLYRPRFAALHRSYGYDAWEPMRRDFSVGDDDRAIDFDQALASRDLRSDYSVREHLRDFAGALKWNVTGAVKSLPGLRKAGTGPVIGSSGPPSPDPR